MMQFDNQNKLFFSFRFPRAFTYGDTRTGHTDKDKREYIRSIASKDFPNSIPSFRFWAFRIFVRKTGNRLFDIENVPKLIIDSFSKRQIQLDGSTCKNLGIFNDDTLDYVREMHVVGERSQEGDFTRVDILGVL